MKLVLHPDALLRELSNKVTDIDDSISDLAQDMFETMRASCGLGLAGVQVGRLQRLFVTDIEGDKPRIFINPMIIGTSIEQGEYDEGCLSIPAIYAGVTRPQAITVQAWTERGRPYKLDADGLLARVIQHELDHLNGVLFIDYLIDGVRDDAMSDYDPAVGLAVASTRPTP